MCYKPKKTRSRRKSSASLRGKRKNHNDFHSKKIRGFFLEFHIIKEGLTDYFYLTIVLLFKPSVTRKTKLKSIGF